MRSFVNVFFFFVFLFFPFQQIFSQKLAAVPYVSGINLPIDLKHCGDDRLFVADRAGRIRVINADGTLRATPFLDIVSKTSGLEGEEGFLGIAFSPDYKTNGKFYVDYTANISGQLSTVIEEYKVSAADSNVADLSSALTLLTQSQPFTNHKAGNLMFGRDGYLYINFGDGGSGGDPFGNGQNKKTFLAKILRIDVSNSSPAQPYAIPPSNPFYSDTTAGVKKEIWAYGVRNPFRSSVDRINGDLWIADVGQNAHEEIDYQPVNDPGGKNYGWNIMEGNFCYTPANCNRTGLSLPIYDYSHSIGFSIIGGYIFRSAQSKSLFGTYIFADYVSRWVDGIRQSGGVLSGDVNHLITAAQSGGNPVSFGEDRYGDQYIMYNGNTTVYKLQDTSYLRRPKAYLTPINQGAGSFILQGLQGKNLTYQWLKNNVAIPGATSPDYSTSILGSYSLEVTNTLNFKDTSDAFLLGSYLNLISFTAQKISEGIVGLRWSTASEQNISGYTLQKRKDNEAVFSDVAFIPDKSVNGFSAVQLDYLFNDLSAIYYKKLFYRLQIRHADNSVSYSDVLILTSDNTKNGFSLFPNPAKGHAQLYLNEFSQPLEMSIYEGTGKKIMEQQLNQQNTTLTLPMSKGLYIVQVSKKDGSNKIRKKLVVQ